jgi:hypothetical protein
LPIVVAAAVVVVGVAVTGIVVVIGVIAMIRSSVAGNG